MSTKKKIAVLPGDGIGVEVTASAVSVLTAACEAAGIELQLDEFPFGTDCYHANGTAFPDATREACLAADAVLLGAVGSANPVNHDELGLLDSLLGLSLVYATTAVPFCTWNLKGYFDTIPRELEEAAIMDGASRWTVFTKVILPLARPALAVTISRKSSSKT